MNIIDRIKKAENDFPQTFTSFVEKEYGILFYDDANINSYDSNHVILFTNTDVNLRDVLTEITTFYLDKGITPRIYQPFENGYFAKHRELLDSLGYKVQTFGYNHYMLLSGENNIKVKNKLEIKRLLEWDNRIANDIFIPAEEEYEIPVLRKIINKKDYFVFVGYIDEVAVVITYIHKTANGCTRFDYILTAKNHRNKGYAREILSYTVEYCKENGMDNCYQWPAHETSEKLCYEAGFRVLFEAEAGEATYCK
ncbi:MAG: hypothetical protein K0R15_1890 [Clostridiales bacterium]|jgi:GNAT superfamily N-acetyltransferase|nr:hypothetical protein [Clostridiales bacterium]